MRERRRQAKGTLRGPSFRAAAVERLSAKAIVGSDISALIGGGPVCLESPKAIPGGSPLVIQDPNRVSSSTLSADERKGCQRHADERPSRGFGNGDDLSGGELIGRAGNCRASCENNGIQLLLRKDAVDEKPVAGAAWTLA